MSSTISAYKRCSIRIYLQLFVRGLMSYASYLCLFAHNGVQHVLTILVTWRVSCWRQELLSFRRRLCSLQVFRVVRVAPLCSFQCCVLVFCLSSSCVLCAQCWQCIWITCLRPVSCVPNVASVSGLFAFVPCLVCPMLPVYLDCLPSSRVLCAQYCQCLWIACLRPVSCVPNVTSVSGLLAFVPCLVCPMLPVSLDCLPSSRVLCAQCCQCLWIACLHPVSCVPNVASVSGLSFTDYIRFSLTFISHVLICRIEIIFVCEQLKE
jgi:hypothetical protein